MNGLQRPTMTGLILFLLGITLLWNQVIAPLYAAQVQRIDRKFQRAFKYHQLRTVQAYYSVLSEKTLREIEEEYDYREAYDRIGRS